MEKLLSVIVPVFNSEKYLMRCVSSLIFQSYKNIEIILVNDGSKDSSKYLCDRLGEMYSQIKVIHKKNGGVSDARNKGLDIAKGDYVTFVDSDDYVKHKTFSILVTCLEKYDADIAECEHLQVWQMYKVDGREDCVDILEYTPIEAMRDFYNKRRFYPSVCGKVFRREVIRDVRFRCGYFREEGLLFNLSTLSNVSKLTFVSNKLYCCQQYPSRHLSYIYSLNGVAQEIESFKISRDYYKDTDEIMFDLGNRVFLRFLYEKMRRCVIDNCSWRIKKQAFYAYANELATYGENFNYSLLPTRKLRNGIRLLRINRFIFRYVYIFYNKYFRRNSNDF